MLLWLIFFIVFIYLEVITINLVTIWFAIGSIFALLTVFITDSLLVQSFVFLLVSVLSLILTKPIVKKLQGKKEATNVDLVIGKIGIVVKEISKDSYGMVNVNGQLWTAMTEDNAILKENTKVKILSIEGVKINVTEVKE